MKPTACRDGANSNVGAGVNLCCNSWQTAETGKDPYRRCFVQFTLYFPTGCASNIRLDLNNIGAVADSRRMNAPETRLNIIWLQISTSPESRDGDILLSGFEHGWNRQ
jgi:hypothetical protein